MRKIIQITGTSGTDRNGQIEDRCFALCDDGTVWSSWYNYHAKNIKWEPLPSIPQEGGEGE